MSRSAALVLAPVIALAIACGASGATPPPAASSPDAAASDAGAVGLEDATAAVDAASPGDLRAGAFVVDATPPLGVPVAGYTKRRHLVPDLNPSNLVHYFGPSEGVRDPIQAKALVLESGGERIAFVSVDTVAILGDSVERVIDAARAKGSKLDRDHIFVFAAHTHSGPGALTDLGFWVQAATDDLVPSVRSGFVDKIASAIIGAEAALAPARYGIGSVDVRGATKNRRVGVSKVFTEADIDPELGVIRVDAASGAPIATLYNYAIHGTTLGATNMSLSADVMGGISRRVEKATGAPAIFANGAEADIAPASEGDAAIDAIGALVGDQVIALRGTVATKDRAKIRVSSETMDFGAANLQLRVDGLSSGALDLGAVATILGAGSGTAQSIKLDATMVDHVFRMSAVALDGDVVSAVPGEPIHTLGFDIKKQGKALGFDHVFVFGFANGYMSYVTDKAEYEAGGYEAVATFFGPDTGSRLVDACVARIAAVK